MAAYEKWENLPCGTNYAFSPTGDDVAFQPFDRSPIHTICVSSLNGDKRYISEADAVVTPLAWSSASELVYSRHEHSSGDSAALWAYSLADGVSRKVIEIDDSFHISAKGVPGHLSLFQGSDGETGLYDLDTSTGEAVRLAAYDGAFRSLIPKPHGLPAVRPFLVCADARSRTRRLAV